MRKLIVNEFVSLDGVAQAPGLPDEDRSGGFEHGGWHMQFFDDTSQKWVLESILEAGAFLFGRRTYEILGAYWPNAPEEEQVIAEPLNRQPKYVASKTLTDPLEWPNSRVLHGDIPQAVRSLKQENDGDIHVIGSTVLVQTLIEHDLVDEFRLMIDPLVLGGGKRVFRDDGARRPLRLVKQEPTTTGAILATYVPAEG